MVVDTAQTTGYGRRRHASKRSCTMRRVMNTNSKANTKSRAETCRGPAGEACGGRNSRRGEETRENEDEEEGEGADGTLGGEEWSTWAGRRRSRGGKMPVRDRNGGNARACSPGAQHRSSIQSAPVLWRPGNGRKWTFTENRISRTSAVS